MCTLLSFLISSTHILTHHSILSTAKNRTDGDNPYTLLQTFPHRQFTASDESRGLRDLGLTPSGTLIMKAGKSVSNAYGGNGAAGGVTAGVWGYVESIVGAATTVVGGVASIFSILVASVIPSGNAGGNSSGGGATLGGEPSDDKDGTNARRLAAQRGSSAGSSSSSLSDSRSSTPRLGRRPFGANIATLSQFDDEDDDDDPQFKSTYNGNSTNQE
ncbi:hypothetical protein BC937DRAFT_92533 [Endogone sp. FLAS-F59071]|nr:hypothetical protein BC937DRAFT_92533 [Endogone sp. FLAS-F59071]|eukprot:RUS15383.1 hypothetical protein BC937DRAFT_92533 [Endogone sp. FLAS-F59071]